MVTAERFNRAMPAAPYSDLYVSKNSEAGKSSESTGCAE